jgi:hypothetical protein
MLGPQDVESAWGWVSKGFSFPYSSIPACDPTSVIIALILSRCVRHDEPSVPKELKESEPLPSRAPLFPEQSLQPDQALSSGEPIGFRLDCVASRFGSLRG